MKRLLEKFLERFLALRQDISSELAPWIQSAMFVTTVLAGFFVFYEFMPDALKYTVPRKGRIYALFAVACLYLFQVASTYRTLLQNERRVRNLEVAFKYDKRGTLSPLPLYVLAACRLAAGVPAAELLAPVSFSELRPDDNLLVKVL